MFYKHSSLDEFPETHPQSENRSIAKDTLNICQQGFIKNRKDQQIDISEKIKNCNDGTKDYPPDYSFAVPKLESAQKEGKIEVHLKTTVGAMHHLVVVENIPRTCGLNFANPVEPGGGFLRGARAQEEAICRVSSLYPSLLSKQGMYEFNRNIDFFSSDYMIYSPDVPFFKDDQRELLDEPFLASIITCPAVIASYVPNNGEKEAIEKINEVMLPRIRKIIQCAIENKVDALVLGAFGCGAFGCDSKEVAELFRKVLIDEEYRKYFDKIVFAIFELRENVTTKEDFKNAFNISEYSE